jgi:hypothetical protein
MQQSHKTQKAAVFICLLLLRAYECYLLNGAKSTFKKSPRKAFCKHRISSF